MHLIQPASHATQSAGLILKRDTILRAVCFEASWDVFAYERSGARSGDWYPQLAERLSGASVKNNLQPVRIFSPWQKHSVLEERVLCRIPKLRTNEDQIEFKLASGSKV